MTSLFVYGASATAFSVLKVSCEGSFCRQTTSSALPSTASPHTQHHPAHPQASAVLQLEMARPCCTLGVLSLPSLFLTAQPRHMHSQAARHESPAQLAPPEHIFYKAALLLVGCQPVLMHGVIPCHAQDFAFVLVESVLFLAPLHSSKSFLAVWCRPTAC